jgi:hypothetical protein
MATSTLGSGTLVLAGTTSGTTTVTATAVAGTTTLTLPAATDTLVGKATTDTLTNKTLTGAAMNGTLGATTPSTVAATSISASTTLGVTGVSTLTGGAVVEGLTVGRGAGAVATNTAVGASALAGNSTGAQSTAMGYQAGYTQSGASQGNTSFGYQSGYAITQGTYNTSIGHTAGSNVSTGTFNTFLGTSAGTDAVFNCTTQSNRVVVGDNAVTNAYIKVAFTATSDARDKTSFAPVPHGLAFVNSLTPTAYQFRVSRENETATGPVRYGFKAQDILAIEGDSPVIIDNSDSKNLKYNQDSMIAILVNAIKELKVEIDSLKAQINGASA